MVYWTGSLIVAILSSLHTCSALRISKNGSATDWGPGTTIAIQGLAYNHAAPTANFRMNGEPKSGTTWVEFIVKNIMAVTCEKMRKESVDETCKLNDYGNTFRIDMVNSNTVFEPDFQKHLVPGMFHGSSFDAGKPPDLNDAEILQKATGFAEQFPRERNMHWFAVLRDPRSVTLSTCYHQIHNCPQADRFTQKRIKPLSKWIDLRHRLWTAVHQLRPDLVKILFYEDLKASPLEPILEMSKFLGTPVSREQAKMIEHDTSFEVMRTMEQESLVPTGGAKTGKVREGSTCNYKKELSPKVAARATDVMRSVLSKELNEKWAC